ncbi:somatomedin B and thrombospondin type 1 domain containing protein vexed [Haematobia irritans]|uniref:somatomedin B and thrombospondin type 1 domain containing protein vexed n=1 Tax=Haematobia irritans TaxID=7368 RepID=UPI003F50AAF4
MKFDNKSNMKSPVKATSESELASFESFMISSNVEKSDTGSVEIFESSTAIAITSSSSSSSSAPSPTSKSMATEANLYQYPQSGIWYFQFCNQFMAGIIATKATRNTMVSILLPLLLPLVVLQNSWLVMAGSCREAQLCCNGRDSSCVVQKAPINAIIEDLNDKPCYCDHACLKLGDCCNDFKDHCGVLDCQVTDWGQWSECNASCGAGIMTRSRKVLQPAQNGGKHCPTLLQKRACQGFRCHGHRHDKKILRETALLLPAGLSHKRHSKQDNNTDGNHNSQQHAHHDNSNSNNNNNNNGIQRKHHHEEEYCVEFEVLRSSKACHKLPPYNLLIEGDRIMVRCDMEAYIPDFMTNEDTHNSSMSPLQKHHNNPTYKEQKYDLPNTSAIMDEEEEEEADIDNDSEENMIDNSSSSNSDEHDEYDTAGALIQKASTATSSSTTTTTPTPYPPLQIRQFHCRGEGLPGRTTRWSALAAPSCRGKWLRLTLDIPKKCTHPQFAFV